MSRFRRRYWLGVVMLALAGCGGAGGTPPPSSSSGPSVRTDSLARFAEEVAVPVQLHAVNGAMTTPGGAVSLKVENERTRPLRIVGLEPIADQGLVVTYLGYSHCAQGCPGALSWDDPDVAGLVAKVEGTFPIVVAPMAELAKTNQDLVRLEFRVSVSDPTAITAIRKGCLWLRAMILTLDDGSRMKITAGGRTPLIGVYTSDDALPGQDACVSGFR